MFGADIGVVLLYAALVMLMFMFIWIIVIPFKLFHKILINIVLGVVCIFVYNIIGHYVHFDIIGINALTGIVIGTLGVPGFVALVIIKTVL